MRYTILATALCFLATVKAFADLMNLPTLSAVSAVTQAAPAMKVFTAQQGYETFSSKFEIEIEYLDGQNETLLLTPEIYAALEGPYNRRNVYGALIAYGPLLATNSHTRKMWQSMWERAFCDAETVLTELGIEADRGIRAASVNYLDQVASSDGYPDRLRVSCE
jgi:hypothetical protein